MNDRAERKTDIFMPIYPGDYQKHTRRLTTEQHGAYFLLLMDYWINGPPPDDDAVLRQITGCSEHSWSNARRSLAPFFLVQDGLWTQKRMDLEINKAKTRKDKAEQGAKARWDGKKRSSKQSSEHSPKQSSEVCTSPTTLRDAPSEQSLNVKDSASVARAQGALPTPILHEPRSALTDEEKSDRAVAAYEALAAIKANQPLPLKRKETKDG